MIQHGVTANIYPSKLHPGDYVFEAHVSTWENGRCMQTRSIANRLVTLATPPSSAPDNDLWTLDLLEIVSQIVEREITPHGVDGVIPANAQAIDTVVKPMLA